MILLLLACADAPAPPAPPARPDAPLPAAPARLGTPKTSADARPAWAGQGRVGYAPQPQSAFAIIERAKELGTGGPMEGGVMACEVSAEQFDGMKLRFGPFETKNKADLRAYLSFGRWAGERAHSALADGARNANWVNVAAPLLSLASGEQVQVDIYDRDLLVDDHIITLEAEFSGAWPLVLAAQGASATCWAVPREEAERLGAPHLASAIDALSVQEGSWHPDLWQDDMGETMRAPMPQPSIEEAAASLGWDDPRVVELNGRLERLWARFAEERLAKLREAESRLPPPGVPIDAEGAPTAMTLLGARCGSYDFPPRKLLAPNDSPLPADGCSFVLRVENKGPIDLPLSPMEGAAPITAATVIDAGGRPMRLELLGQVVNKQLATEVGVLAPGDSAVLVFSVAEEPQSEPWMLRLHAGAIEGQGRWMLLRLL